MLALCQCHALTVLACKSRKRCCRHFCLLRCLQDFLNGVCTHIIWLTKQKLTYYTGNYDTFCKTVKENEVIQQKKYEKEQDDIKHLKAFISSCGMHRAHTVVIGFCFYNLLLSDHHMQFNSGSTALPVHCSSKAWLMSQYWVLAMHCAPYHRSACTSAQPVAAIEPSKTPAHGNDARITRTSKMIDLLPALCHWTSCLQHQQKVYTTCTTSCTPACALALRISSHCT